jgi:glycosyltransferase involved in cell wall biosynthesis
MLFVITRGDSIGGGQIHVRDMARALQARGVRVGVASGSAGALQAELAQTGIPFFVVHDLVRSINPFFDLVAIGALRRRIRHFKPDLVSCHTSKAGLVGRLAALLEGVPAVFTAHGWQFAEGIPIWQKLTVLSVEIILARLTPRIITVSGYDRDLALKYKLGSPAKIRLVHNGMPWLDKLERREGSSSTVRLIMVARFQTQKDHATLFEALSRLEDLPWSLELVGDGPDMARWQAWVDARGWSGRVRFSGQVLDVPRRLEATDIFVLASLWEGFPRSILEAMRASLPVVVSDVGGVRESVDDGVNGYVVPVRDATALADRLARLLADASLRRSLGDAGRARYENEFTFEAMLARTQNVWDQVRR